MTDQFPLLDAHTAAFRGELGTAAARRTRRTRRARRGFAIAVPLAGAATVAIAAFPGDRGTVVERAAAALAPETGVIHMRLTSDPVGAVERPACEEDPADVWLQTGPNAPKTPGVAHPLEHQQVPDEAGARGARAPARRTEGHVVRRSATDRSTPLTTAGSSTSPISRHRRPHSRTARD